MIFSAKTECMVCSSAQTNDWLFYIQKLNIHVCKIFTLTPHKCKRRTFTLFMRKKWIYALSMWKNRINIGPKAFSRLNSTYNPVYGLNYADLTSMRMRMKIAPPMFIVEADLLLVKVETRAGWTYSRADSQMPWLSRRTCTCSIQKT